MVTAGHPGQQKAHSYSDCAAASRRAKWREAGYAARAKSAPRIKFAACCKNFLPLK